MLKFVSTKARRAIHLMTRRGELEVQLVQLTVPLFCFVVGLPVDYRYLPLYKCDMGVIADHLSS
jgi:hypothetical protein